MAIPRLFVKQQTRQLILPGIAATFTSRLFRPAGRNLSCARQRKSLIKSKMILVSLDLIWQEGCLLLTPRARSKPPRKLDAIATWTLRLIALETIASSARLSPTSPLFATATMEAWTQFRLWSVVFHWHMLLILLRWTTQTRATDQLSPMPSQTWNLVWMSVQ